MRANARLPEIDTEPVEAVEEVVETAGTPTASSPGSSGAAALPETGASSGALGLLAALLVATGNALVARRHRVRASDSVTAPHLG